MRLCHPLETPGPPRLTVVAFPYRRLTSAATTTPPRRLPSPSTATSLSPVSTPHCLTLVKSHVSFFSKGEKTPRGDEGRVVRRIWQRQARHPNLFAPCAPCCIECEKKGKPIQWNRSAAQAGRGVRTADLCPAPTARVSRPLCDDGGAARRGIQVAQSSEESRRNRGPCRRGGGGEDDDDQSLGKRERRD